MGRLITLLSVVLAVQIGLVAWVYRNPDRLGTFNASKPLVDVSLADIDQVAVAGEGGEELVLKREEGVWVLPEKNGFPVSAKKLDAFLKKLLAAEPSWPVGTTQVAAKQLEVAEDAFERRIRLLGNGEVLGELYLGSSPGFRKIHARLAGSLDTHVIDFNAFDAPTNPADWYDRELLRLSKDDLARIDLGTFALKNGEAGFELEGVTEGEQLNSDKLEEILRAVTSLGFLDELAEQGKDAFEQGELILEYTVTRKDGQDVTYTVVAPSEADYYVLKTSTHPYHFKVAKQKFDDLRALGREQLVQAGDRKSEVGDPRSESGDQESEAGN